MSASSWTNFSSEVVIGMRAPPFGLVSIKGNVADRCRTDGFVLDISMPRRVEEVGARIRAPNEAPDPQEVRQLADWGGRRRPLDRGRKEQADHSLPYLCAIALLEVGPAAATQGLWRRD